MKRVLVLLIALLIVPIVYGVNFVGTYEGLWTSTMWGVAGRVRVEITDQTEDNILIGKAIVLDGECAGTTLGFQGMVEDDSFTFTTSYSACIPGRISVEAKLVDNKLVGKFFARDTDGELTDMGSFEMPFVSAPEEEKGEEITGFVIKEEKEGVVEEGVVYVTNVKDGHFHLWGPGDKTTSPPILADTLEMVKGGHTHMINLDDMEATESGIGHSHELLTTKAEEIEGLEKYIKPSFNLWYLVAGIVLLVVSVGYFVHEKYIKK